MDGTGGEDGVAEALVDEVEVVLTLDEEVVVVVGLLGVEEVEEAEDVVVTVLKVELELELEVEVEVEVEVELLEELLLPPQGALG